MQSRRHDCSALQGILRQKTWASPAPAQLKHARSGFLWATNGSPTTDDAGWRSRILQAQQVLLARLAVWVGTRRCLQQLAWVRAASCGTLQKT